MSKRFSLKLNVIVLLMLILTLAFSSIVFASEVSDAPRVVTGDEGGTLSDAFRGVKEQNNANINADVMAEADKHITSFAGTITSCIIYLIFALTGFTTACDLLYIGVPFLRPYLYDGDLGQNMNGSANANLIGRNMGWTASAMGNMANANRHGANAQGYQQMAQQKAMMGDMRGARHAMHMANSENSMANRQMQWANRNMNEQAKSDAWRAQHNQDAMQRAQRRANNNIQ